MPKTTPVVPFRIKIVTLGAVLAVLLGGYIYRTTRPAPPDPLLQAVFAKASAVEQYAQEDRTEALVGDRRLVIRGTYLVDRAHNSYASVATTTVYTPPQKTGQSFTLSNISIGNEVYSKMEVGGVAPHTSIPSEETWHRFASNAIPDDYVGIAVPGPLLDDLRLFSENGSYLTLMEQLPAPTASSSPLGYRFRLSGKLPPSPGGTLEALIGHIGTGTIDAWIQPWDATIQTIAIHAVGYHATATLSRFDEALSIEAPVE